MDDKFDIFECPPEGGLLWRDSAENVEKAKRKTLELAAKSHNEFRVMHIPTKTVVARVNQTSAAGRG
jgi:hypothetical protein